jgi:radical SAM protein with 4Fe4S-binding SPASM domain
MAVDYSGLDRLVNTSANASPDLSEPAFPMARLVVAQPDYRERRGDKTLFFWGDYPHWLITNRAGVLILDLLRQERPLPEVVRAYGQRAMLDESTARADVNTLLEPLAISGVVYRADRPPMLPSVRDQLDIDAVIRSVRSSVLNLTLNCNYRCDHCYASAGIPKVNELTAEEILGIFEQFRPFCRMKILGILGGEPLMRMRDLLRIADHLRDRGWLTSVSTNGSLVTRQFARRAAELDMIVQVSVDGATAESCDSVRGPGAFARALRATRLLVEHGARPLINMVYHRGNVGELEQFIELGEALGVRGARFIPFNFRGRGLRGDFTKVMHYEMVVALRDILRRRPQWADLIALSFLGNIASIVRLSPRYAYCGTGAATFLIDSNGDLYPCQNLVFPEFRIGNLREQPFEQLWLHAPLLQRLRSLCVETLNEKCPRCPVRYLCGGGCRMEIYGLTSRLDLPTFWCGSWPKAVWEMCWTLDEFPALSRRIAEERVGTWMFEPRIPSGPGNIDFLVSALNFC